VLAVDDDPALREFYVDILSREGHAVIVAENGEDALRHLTPPPDLILLDLGMPVLDGYSFLRRMPESPEYARVPVIVVTSGPVLLPLLAGSRSLAVLPKPFDFDVMLELVRTLANPPPLN
jgi:DNA-binding response OmpR family regulator